MFGEFPIATAQLAGVLCEAIFYGINLVSCMFCTRTLLLMDRRTARLRQAHRMMASIAIIFFFLSTWDLAIGILHLFHAFIEASDPTAEFNKVADWINIARSLNQTTIVLLGDFMLIYRCWIVYGRRWRVMMPSLILYLVAIAMGIKALQVEIDPHIDDPLNLEIRPWFTTQFGVNAAQNILTMGMLVWRIWRVVKDVDGNTNCPTEDYQQRPVYKAMRVVAESGMVYTTTVLATFLVSSTSSNAVYIVSDMSLQTAGIVFNVILVRCHTERNDQELPIGDILPMSGRATPVCQFKTEVDPNQKPGPENRATTPVPCVAV